MRFLALGIVAVAAWAWWEIKTAMLVENILPMSRKCAWCGQHMSDEDKWLEENGARVTHTICSACEYHLSEGDR